jgi:hypothetical protein
MTKLFASLFAAALLIGLGSAPTLTYAQDEPMEDAEEDAMDTGDESSTMEEDTTDEAPAEDPIEEAEDSE